MMDSEVRQRYLDMAEHDENFLYYQNSSFKTIWNKIRVYEGETGLCIDDFRTKEDFTAFYNRFFSSIRRKGYFVNHKVLLRHYVYYLIESGVMPESVRSEFEAAKYEAVDADRKSYFKSLLNLKRALDDTIDRIGPVDDAAYDSIRCACYLYWFGLTGDEVVNLKREDVLDNGIRIANGFLELPDFVMDVMKRYRDGEEYVVMVSHLMVRQYVDSPYLFRTYVSESVTHHNMDAVINKMNRAADYPYDITYKTIRMSGMFNRLVRYELENGDISIRKDKEVLSKLFQIPLDNINLIMNYYNEYEKYKRVML